MVRWFFSTVTVVVGLLMFYEWDTFDPVSIRGKRVLITGASSGIGEELAYQYSKLGASVVITARREQLLQKVATKCKQLGATKVEYVVADMAKPEDRQKVVSEAEKSLGGLDHLILNHAALGEPAPWIGSTENMTLLNYELQVNVIAYVDIASKCLKMLSASNGNIGVVSSLAGRTPLTYYSAYSANKFALHGFFAAFRQELRLRGVNVSVTLLVLGYIATEGTTDLVGGASCGLLGPTPAAIDDTVRIMIKEVAMRSNEIRTPKWARYVIFFDQFFPIFVQDYCICTATFVSNKLIN